MDLFSLFFNCSLLRSNTVGYALGRDCLIDFNSMSKRPTLFYAESIGNHIFIVSQYCVVVYLL